MIIYLCLAVLMGFCEVHTQAAEDPAAAAIKTPCDADIYLAAVEEQLSQRLKANGDTTKDITNQARKLHLAAVATTDPTQSCLLGAVATAAAHKARTADQQSATRDSTFKLALTQINKLQRELAEISTLSQLKLALKTNGHRRKDTSEKTHSIIQADAATPLGCSALNKNRDGKINDLTPEPSKLLSLRIADESKKTQGTTDNALELTMASSFSSDPQSYADWRTATASCVQGSITSLSPTIIQTGIHPTQRTEHIKSLQIYKNTDAVGSCNPKHDDATEDTKPAEYAAKAICQALRTSPTEAKQLTFNGEALAAEPLNVQAAGSCLPQYRGKSKLSEEEQATLTKFLKDAYGKDNDAFNAKFTTLKPGHKVKIYKGGEVQAVDIGDVNTDDKAINAMSIILADRAAQIAAAQQKAAVDSKKSEKCKEDTEESKCTADKDCEHKDGKCQVKDSVKAENDEKKPQTPQEAILLSLKRSLFLLAFFIIA
uniref:Variant surface glycoprotein n=1 Tax=Trypanosoma brucei TaxID=5691 RepID=A0A1V0FXX2_9TRYP|nr:variant surface glycoprotein [Trypanosoma brucei]